MKSITTISLILIFLTLTLSMSCSSEKGKVNINEESNNNPVTLDRSDETLIPPPDLPIVSILLHQMIVIPVDKFYICNGRVPQDFNELADSGLLMGIPTCPYTNTPYHAVQELSESDPSGFVYYSSYDQEYRLSYLQKEDGDFKIIESYKPESSWKEALINEKGPYMDSKIMALQEYFTGLVIVYINRHSKFPETPAELLEGQNLVKAGWAMPTNPGGAYYEFGIDTAHQRTYHRMRYLFGKGGIGCRNYASYMATNEEELTSGVQSFGFNDTPPPDILVLNPWFTTDTLEQFYNSYTNK